MYVQKYGLKIGSLLEVIDEYISEQILVVMFMYVVGLVFNLMAVLVMLESQQLNFFFNMYWFLFSFVPYFLPFLIFAEGFVLSLISMVVLLLSSEFIDWLLGIKTKYNQKVKEYERKPHD